MNILPKKNWHVRKKENIARVRRDEAEAAEKEKEIERRAKFAEQEARLIFLRNRARERDGFNKEDENPSATSTEKSSLQSEADIFTATGNINFFKEAESGLTKTGTNKEYEEEKKAIKEDFEKKIGLLTYLGQDTLESQKKTAWFNERDHVIGKRCIDDSEEKEIGMKSKSKLDPLNEIRKHTGTSSFPTVAVDFKLPAIKAPTETPLRCKTKNPCKKNKKHKREKSKKKKRKHSLSSDSESQSKKKKKKKHSRKRKFDEVSNSDSEEEANRLARQAQLATLREERLKREAHERKRAERLLAGKDADAEEKEPNSSQGFKQKYNSQFNPHLAKQNQEKPEGIQSVLQPGVKYWLQ
ncbi:UNVERIFIED_CONTAM: hypothetical protein RMT77_010892 [Armadillidium vulgare]|nr:Leukocyte receptor cluster member 1 [Armadillidium vulgare]